jgi:UDP-N-acetylenolpyruvoylglucosamine reductase
VFMNAGADGQDTASVLWQVEVVSPDGSEIRSLARGDLVGRFGYRTSPFMEDDTGRVLTEDQEEGKHFKATGVFGDAPEDANNFKQVASSNSPAYAGWIILSATFRLTKDSNAPSTAKACMRRRRTTQPLSERSVGCWFRNPGTGAESAGALIDKGTSPHFPNHRRLFYLSAGDCLSIHRDIHY